MRLLKTLLIALFALAAVTVGAIAAAAIAVGGIAFFLVRRLLRNPVAARPQVRGPARSPSPAPAGGEVIDVTATEVR